MATLATRPCPAGNYVVLRLTLHHAEQQYDAAARRTWVPVEGRLDIITCVSPSKTCRGSPFMSKMPGPVL